MAEKSILHRLMTETWPARAAKSALEALMLPGDVYAGRVDPMSDEGIGKATDLAGLVMGGAYAAAPAVKNASGMGIKAYHGSPHDFDRFDLSKIGTGEGAQAYGHGLYFADNETVARTYRDKVSAMRGTGDLQVGGRKINWDDPLEGAAFEVMRHGGDREAAAEFAARTYKRGSPVPDIIRSGVELPEVRSPGRMYEVDINAHPDQFLDWDKPLRDQPGVDQSLRNIRESANLKLEKQGDWWGYVNPEGRLIGHAHRNPDVVKQRGPFPDRDSGAMTYRDIAASFSGDSRNHAAATSALREAGIPGIKYLDQGSRAAGDGSRNYVVFDDSLISILRKYGLPMTAGPLAALMAMGNEPAQAAP